MKSLCSLNPFFVAVTFLLWVSPACAQTITVTQPLQFGTIVLSDFTAVGRVTMFANGTFSRAANTYIISNPQRGEYDLNGFPANQAFTITLPASVPISDGSSTFTIDDFTTLPASPITDSSGNATIFIGGRMQSSGGGTPYLDGTYDNNFLITIDY